MIVVFASILAVVLVLVVKFFVNLNALHEKLKGYARPPGDWLLGHTSLFSSTTTILPAIREQQLKYGGLIRFDVGFCYPFLVITDLKYVESILTSNKFLEKSADYRFLHKWLGTGLLTSAGKKWFARRKLITPAFHFQILEQFVDVFNSCSAILIEKFGRKLDQEIDIAPHLILYSLDVTCETSLGTSIDAQSNEHSDYVTSVREVTKIFAMRGFSILKQIDFFYFFSRDYWKERKAIKVIHGYAWDVIRRRRNDIENAGTAREGDGEDSFGRKKRKAFLDLLLECKLDGKPLEDDEIREEVDTIMFAGQDTSSTAMTFVLHCLAENPEVQELVVKELREIFADDWTRDLRFRDLQEMKYLEMVIKETIRLFPPVAMFAREVSEDEELFGRVLPKEVPIVVFAFGLHRDPEVFPDPEKFDPERFTADNQAKRHPFAYIPFSAGTRNCIGQKFAMLLMKATLANLLRNFEVFPVKDRKIELCFQTVLKSNNGVYVKFRKRL